MTDAELEAAAERRTLLYRFWALWLSIWSAWGDPFDIGL
jgi:hypothetical protein